MSLLKDIDKNIKKLFHEWKSLRPLKKEYEEKLNKKIRLDWNYNSNHIEGNTLTYGQTELLIFFGRLEGGHLERNYMEMKAHDVAINKVREFAQDKERKLSESDIRNLNQIVLKEPFWREAETPDGGATRKQIIPGKYKAQPNHVRTATGETFKFAEPSEVPAKMAELIQWFHQQMSAPIPSIASFLAELHHRFITIHPFDDGNGRVIRLWLNYALLSLDYPPLVIKSEDKENYFIALNKADTGDIDSLAVYLGQVLISWMEIAIKAAKGKSIEESSDIDKEVKLYIQEQKGKGLSDSKILSKENVLRLCDNFLKPFLETLKSKFACFDDLFERKTISPQDPLLTDDIDEIAIFDDDVISMINGKKPWDEYLDKGVKEMRFKLLNYKKFRGKNGNPKQNSFSMAINMSLAFSIHDYTINTTITRDQYPSYQITRKEIYNYFWGSERINRFVSEIKKEFFELMKKD